LRLYRGMQDAGLEDPTMWVETLLLSRPEDIGWLCELLETVQPRFAELGVRPDELGSFDSLRERIVAEQKQARSFTPFAGLACVHAVKAA